MAMALPFFRPSKIQVIYHDQAVRAEKKGALDKSTVLYDSRGFKRGVASPPFFVFCSFGVPFAFHYRAKKLFLFLDGVLLHLTG